MMRRRRPWILISVFAGVLALTLGLRIQASRIAWSRIAATLRDEYGLAVEAADFSIAIFDATGTVKGLRISEGVTDLLEIDEVTLSSSIRDMIRGEFDFTSVVVTRPVLHVRIEAEHGTNLERIFARRDPPSGTARNVYLRDARILDGRVEIEDSITDDSHPAQLTFERIALTASELQIAGEPRSSDVGDIRLDAELRQQDSPARITLVAWGPPWKHPLTIAAHAAITGLDLAQIPQYVKSKTRSSLGGDVIHVACALRVQDGVIEDGAIGAEVVPTGVEVSLRFGGTTEQVVFDENSKLAALIQLPFARLGHLGDVALTSTWGAASAVGGGVVDAGESIAGGVADSIEEVVRLDPLGAVEAAGGGLLHGAKAIGEGVLGGVRKLFAGLDDEEQDAETRRAEDRDFAVRHEKCRRALLKAALASATEPSGERRRRIELEMKQAATGSDSAAAKASL